MLAQKKRYRLPDDNCKIEHPIFKWDTLIEKPQQFNADRTIRQIFKILSDKVQVLGKKIHIFPKISKTKRNLYSQCHGITALACEEEYKDYVNSELAHSNNRQPDRYHTKISSFIGFFIGYIYSARVHPAHI